MPKYKQLEEAYSSCLANGEIKIIAEVNTQKIKDLVKNAETNISAANIIKKALKKDSREWMNVYINCYEAIRIFAEALLITEKLKVSNHQCLFSCICVKFPNLELDWGFFEKIRTKGMELIIMGNK